MDGTVGLVSSDAEPTHWNAGFVGEKFSYDGEGVHSTAQDLTKSLQTKINGDLLAGDGNVKEVQGFATPTVGDLDVDSLAARYSTTADSKPIAGDPGC